MEWEEYAGLPRWDQYNHRGIYKMETEKSEKRHGEEIEIGIMCFENEKGDTNEEMQAASKRWQRK